MAVILVPYRRWKHLDEWDGLLFVISFIVVATAVATFVPNAQTELPRIGFGVAFATFAVRRVFDKRLDSMEAGPPPPPMGVGLLLVVAFAVISTLVALVALLLAVAGLADTKGGGAVVALFTFPVALVAATLSIVSVRFVRKRRRVPADSTPQAD